MGAAADLETGYFYIPSVASAYISSLVPGGTRSEMPYIGGGSLGGIPNPGGVPWDPSFDLKLVQYAPVAIVIVIGGAMLWWVLSARNWFTGPVSDVETPLDPHLLSD